MDAVVPVILTIHIPSRFPQWAQSSWARCGPTKLNCLEIRKLSTIGGDPQARYKPIVKQPTRSIALLLRNAHRGAVS
jgi:hypothetical protein